MITNKLLKVKSIRNKVMASVFLLSIGVGAMFVSDKNNIDAIKEEQAVISEMTNKTLNISFVPNNPNMKNNINLFNPINQNDIDNISKIQGVKSVKPIDKEFNPLSGYAKINSKSSYIELYGIDEKGNDAHKDDIEMIYGRAINSNDIGKNVIVLNMETVNSLQIADAKSLIGTGVEINGSLYEVIGVMNVVLSDKRDNSNEIQYSSLIPKTTSKEVLARANANSSVYGSITIEIADGANINSVESSVYNLLYDNHKDINGYYERDSEYSLPKKLDPTLTILDNYRRLSLLIEVGTILLSVVALFRVFVLNSKKEILETIEDNIDEKEDKEVELESQNNSVDEENIVEKNDAFSLRNTVIENVSMMLFGFALSYLLSSYYLSSMNIVNLFNISIVSKLLVILVSVYMIKVQVKDDINM